MAKLYGSLEAGGTKFVCAVGDEKFQVIEKTQFPTTTPYETIDRTIEFFKRYEDQLEGIAIGSFGPIDVDPNSETYGFVTSTPKPHWSNIDLLGLIAKEFNVPFYFTTDVNSSAYGETLARKGVKSLVYYTIGTGIGAGAMYVSLGNKTTEETTLVSMKGDTVTVGDVFNSLKGSNQTQQSVLSATLQKVLEKEYGSKVSKEDIDKAYKQASEQYGDQFSQVLAAYGQTEESYRTQIRTQKLVEYAVNQAAQKDLTEANYKAAYDNYTPNTEVQVVSTTDKAVADKVVSEAKSEGADFSKVAKDNSLKVTSKTVNSASQDFPTDVLTAAFKQDANAVSDVVTVSNSSTGAATYYVVKTVSKSEKNADWKNYKDDLTKVIINGKKADTNFTNSVIAKVLKKYNVKVVDKSFSAILDQYVTGSGASSSSTSSSSK